MTRFTSIHNALPVVPAGQVPEWVHLTPAGEFRGMDGRGPYRVPDAQALIVASMAAGRLPLDENHSIDLAATTGAPSPARGWIVEMQARDDGIWGRVDWTATGRQLLEDRAYRGISPVLGHSKQGDVSLVLRAALTNAPNFALTTSITSSRTPG